MWATRTLPSHCKVDQDEQEEEAMHDETICARLKFMSAGISVAHFSAADQEVEG